MGGTESIVTEDNKAVDAKNFTEGEVNGTITSAAGHNTESNNVVRQRYAVRRLTPTEAERLQGLPIVRKMIFADCEYERVILVQWFENENLQENQKISVRYAVEKCRKRQKYVGNVESDKSLKAVWCAVKNLLQNCQKINKLVLQNVPINCEGNIQEKLNLREKLGNVCNVEKSSECHLQNQDTNFVQFNAPINTTWENTTHNGETVQQQNENQTHKEELGKELLEKFGKEIMELVKDVGNNLMERKDGLRFTTYDLTEIVKNQGMIQKILSFFVANVTTLHILKPENIAVLLLNDKPFTLIDDKTCSDSARYKAIGNGMAQPIATWLIKRIVEEVENEPTISSES